MHQRIAARKKEPTTGVAPMQPAPQQVVVDQAHALLYLKEKKASKASKELEELEESEDEDEDESEESTNSDDSKERSEEVDFLSSGIGRTWKQFGFVQLRRFASKLRLATGSNPTVEYLKKIIGKKIAKAGGLEKLQQDIRTKDRVRVKTLKTDEEYQVLKQGQAWKKMEHTELRRFAKHLLVPTGRNPTALELIKNIGKALAKERKKGTKQ